MNTRTLASIQAVGLRPALAGAACEMAGGHDDQRTSAESTSSEASSAIDAGAPLSAPASMRAFILAGKAIFTLQGTDTRYTFRVNRAEPKPGSQYTSTAYFVSLLTGQDNLNDYTYLGMLISSTGDVRLTRSSKYTADSKPVQAINWAFRHIWAGRALPAPATFYHVGRCGRCGRALTVPTSIETGFGPECAGKL